MVGPLFRASPSQGVTEYAESGPAIGGGLRITKSTYSRSKPHTRSGVAAARHRSEWARRAIASVAASPMSRRAQLRRESDESPNNSAMSNGLRGSFVFFVLRIGFLVSCLLSNSLETSRSFPKRKLCPRRGCAIASRSDTPQ